MTTAKSVATAQPAAGPLRISVIMPSHNSGAFLREALTSALDQDPPPHEIVVQDGESTDDTLAILRSFGGRVAWVSAPDGGQSDALNLALARATGDIVLWLNADDVILPGALAAATAAFVADPGLAFAYGSFDIINGVGAVVRRYTSSDYSWDRVYSRGCYIFSGSVFIRRQVLARIGGFDASLRACMDLDLMLRLGAAGRSLHLGQTISQFRMQDSNKSSSIKRVFIIEAFQVRRRHAQRSPRRWLVAMRAVVMSAAVLATTRQRYSRRWPRYGRGKSL